VGGFAIGDCLETVKNLIGIYFSMNPTKREDKTMTNLLLAATTYKLKALGVDKETARTMKAVESAELGCLSWWDSMRAYGTSSVRMATLNRDYIDHIKDKLRG